LDNEHLNINFSCTFKIYDVEKAVYKIDNLWKLIEIILKYKTFEIRQSNKLDCLKSNIYVIISTIKRNANEDLINYGTEIVNFYF